MASIYPNYKDGKVISFKIKAFLGRDENGKQITKCKTWTLPKPMSEQKATALARKEAAVWEHDMIWKYFLHLYRKRKKFFHYRGKPFEV